VVVPPQVAIGATGKFMVVPRYVTSDGKIASLSSIQSNDSSDVKIMPTTIMNISWSADHRVIDGATVAKFSKLWTSYLEDPIMMMVEL
jgi:2-oxoisovalerate dehydrogenase E2 component (dihydrolipoyl transacylase)